MSAVNLRIPMSQIYISFNTTEYWANLLIRLCEAICKCCRPKITQVKQFRQSSVWWFDPHLIVKHFYGIPTCILPPYGSNFSFICDYIFLKTKALSAWYLPLGRVTLLWHFLMGHFKKRLKWNTCQKSHTLMYIEFMFQSVFKKINFI